MKIEFELPDWAEERGIYIFAGIEKLGYKFPDEKLYIKTSRCNMCGKCCMNLKTHSHPIVDGKCIHLKKEVGNNPRWLCRLGLNRPFGCGLGTPSNMPECTEKYEVVE